MSLFKAVKNKLQSLRGEAPVSQKTAEIPAAPIMDVHIIRTLEKGPDNVERVTPSGVTGVRQATAVEAVSKTASTATRTQQPASGKLHAVQQPQRAAKVLGVADVQHLYKQLIGIVPHARELAKRKQQLTAKTQADYRKKAHSIGLTVGTLDQLLKAQDDMDRATQLMSTVLGKYAHNSCSFFAMRAAAKASLQEHLSVLLQEQDKFQKELRGKTQDKQSTQQVWDKLSSLIQRVQDACKNYERIQSLNRQQCLAAYENAKAQHAQHSFFQAQEKKGSIKTLVHLLDKHDSLWKQRFRDMQNNTKSRYRAHAWIQSVTGIRPEEFNPDRGSPGSTEPQGIQVTLGEAGQLCVTIKGAKLKDKAGQKRRSVEIDAAKAQVPKWLLESIQANDGVLYLSAKPDALAKHYQRISAQMYSDKSYGRLKTRLHITPYAFRHSLAADLRDDGWSDIEIAEILGQQSAETSLWYGKRRRGRGLPAAKNHALIKGRAQVSTEVRAGTKRRDYSSKGKLKTSK